MVVLESHFSVKLKPKVNNISFVERNSFMPDFLLSYPRYSKFNMWEWTNVRCNNIRFYRQGGHGLKWENEEHISLK